MKSRQEIKAIARLAIGEQRATGIATLVLVAVASYAGTLFNYVPGGYLGVLLVGASMFFVDYPMGVNSSGIFIKLYKGEEASAAELFTNLRVNYMRKVGGSAWMWLFIYLWMMVVFVPAFFLITGPTHSHVGGVIIFLLAIPVFYKVICYSFTGHILADCLHVPARHALKLSIRMTAGYRLALFVMYLSFIGWFGICAFGIFMAYRFNMSLGVIAVAIFVFVFVGPYINATLAGYYVELREKALETGAIAHEEIWPWVHQ